MNPFERFNIRSISPTMISQWDSAPATLILKRVFGVKSKATAKMWRGDAVEAGLQFWLYHKDRDDALANAKALAVDTFWQRANGEVTEEAENEVLNVPAMVEQAADACSNRNSRIMASQLVVEHFLDGVAVPAFGKMDFVFEDKSIIELKTTTRCPSSVDGASLSHRWQAALYATARNQPVSLTYATTKKSAVFEILPNDPVLGMMRQSAMALQTALQKCSDGATLLRSLPLNVESFYWDDEMRQSYEEAVDGKLKALVGPGTEDLAAQGYVTFGKHAGKHISELPASYLNWLLNPMLSDKTLFDVPVALQDAIQTLRKAA